MRKSTYPQIRCGAEKNGKFKLSLLKIPSKKETSGRRKYRGDTESWRFSDIGQKTKFDRPDETRKKPTILKKKPSQHVGENIKKSNSRWGIDGIFPAQAERWANENEIKNPQVSEQ